MMEISSVNNETLGQLLKENSSKCLLLDCRSFFAFNASHVENSINVRFSTIVKRRAKGTMGIEHIVPNEESRNNLISGHYSYVVIFDEMPCEFDMLKKDCTVHLAVNTLCRESYGARITFLRGKQIDYLTFVAVMTLKKRQLNIDATKAWGHFNAGCITQNHIGLLMKPRRASNQ